MMLKFYRRPAFLAAASVAAMLAFSVPASGQSLVLKGADGVDRTVAAAAIAALPRVSVPLTAHGEAHLFEGPLLIDVLKIAGVESGAALRGPALGQAVVVRARDGYAIVLGLAELDTGIRPNRIILADSINGEPIAADDGPFRVVAEGDVRPARSARQVTSVEVVQFTGSGELGDMSAHR